MPNSILFSTLSVNTIKHTLSCQQQMHRPGQLVDASMHRQQQHHLDRQEACGVPKNYYVSGENHLKHQIPPAVFLTNTKSYQKIIYPSCKVTIYDNKQYFISMHIEIKQKTCREKEKLQFGIWKYSLNLSFQDHLKIHQICNIHRLKIKVKSNKL